MAESLTLELQGIEQLQQALAQAPAVVQQELGVFLHAMVQHMRSEVIDRTPAAYGTLRASISGVVENQAGGQLGIVSTPQPYAVPVELGTKPHFPPVQALEDWVRQKLGLTGREGRSVAFAIARKIGQVGTKGHYMFRDAFEANTAEIERQFDQTVSRIVARI